MERVSTRVYTLTGLLKYPNQRYSRDYLVIVYCTRYCTFDIGVIEWCRNVLLMATIPVKTLLQDLARKGPFSCTLQDPAGFCRKFLQDSCRIPQDLARSCRGARKKELFLQERFYWDRSWIFALLLGTQVSGYIPRGCVMKIHHQPMLGMCCTKSL